MSTKIKKLPKSKVKITAAPTKKDLEKAENKALKN